MRVRHTTLTAKPNDPTKDISANAWNEDHYVEPPTPAEIGAEAAGVAASLVAAHEAAADPHPGYVLDSAFTYANLGGKPTTLSGYGITDAVDTSSTQTVGGVKTFSSAPILPHSTAINGATSTARRVRWTTANSLRWDMGASGDPESGSNAGTNFALNRYDDTGTFLGAVWSIPRNTGVINYTSTPTVGGVAVSLSNHTHTASQVTDFAEAVDDRVAALLVAGSNVTLTYNDVANTLTIASTGGGGGAPDFGLDIAVRYNVHIF